MYTYNTRVSYSRLDKTGRVPYHEIINYLQDCSTFQSEELGVGVEHLKAQNKAWVMLAHKIQIVRELQLGEEIVVGTCPTDFGKVMATRQFFIKDKTGEFVVKAESIWGLIDIQERIPIRIAEEDCYKYNLEKAFDSIRPSRKIRFSRDSEFLGKVEVSGIDIDTNGHVNNANYLRMIWDYLPENEYYNQVEIVYNKEALEGEKITCIKYNEKDGIGMSLKDENGETHAQVKLNNI